MDLREYLQTLQTGADASANFAKTAAELRQQAAIQQFAGQVPELAQNQDVGGLVSGALSYGNQAPLNSYVAKTLEGINKANAPVKPGAELLTQEVVDAAKLNNKNADASSLDALVGKVDMKTGLTAINNFEKAQAGNKAEQRRGEQFDYTKFKTALAARQKLSDNVAKIDKEIEKDIAPLKTGLKTFEVNSSPGATSNLISGLLRAGGDNKISDADRSSFQSVGLVNSWGDVENYLRSNPGSKLSEAQRQELIRIARSNLDSAEERRQHTIGSHISAATRAYPGMMNDQTKKLAEDYGLKLDQPGEVTKSVKEATLDVKNPETGVADIEKLNKLIGTISDTATYTVHTNKGPVSVTGSALKASAANKLNAPSVSNQAITEVANRILDALKK